MQNNDSLRKVLVKKTITPRVYRYQSGHLNIAITHNKKTYNLSPGLPPIPSIQWRADDQRVKHKALIKYKGRTYTGSELNEHLDIFCASVGKHVERYNALDKEQLERDLQIVPAYNDKFYPQVFAFIKGMQTITEGTRRNKAIIWRKIQSWFPDLSWSAIDLNFYDALLHRLKDYAQPGAYIIQIKNLCRLAEDRNYPVCQDYKKKSFRVVTFDAKDSSVYLSQDDLDKLFALDDEVVNGFLVGCYTGQRHSDWHKCATPIDGDHIKLIQQKTKRYKKIVTVPVRPQLRQLWNRKIRLLSASHTNHYMHHNLKLDKHITTHTARRTFCTLAFYSGVPLAVIAKVSGHSSEKQLQTYLKVTAEDIVQMTSHYAFFK